MLPTDLRPDLRWIASGFLLTLFSGFGQTFYIAIFAGHLKAELGISDGQFGSLYTVGTLASAALLVWAGKLADRYPIRWLGVGVLAGLATVSLGMASVTSTTMLAVVLFGLRFFGQGASTHVAMTAMARWFNRKRGRAIAMAVLGFSLSEAAFPLLAVGGIGLIGWRLTWVAATVVVVLVAMPILVVLLRYERMPTVGAIVSSDGGDEAARRHWTRGEVLKSPLFYAMLPGLLAPSFIVTGILFNQVTIVEIKGWELSWFAASFPVLAGVGVVAALAAGWAIDRVGARRLLPGILIPTGLAILLLTSSTQAWILPVFMGLLGLAHGVTSTVSGALWAELYGTDHLGAIRSIVTAGMVFASALSPGLMGVLLDAGVALETQLLTMAAYCVVAVVWMGALVPRLDRIAAVAGGGPAGDLSAAESR